MGCVADKLVFDRSDIATKAFRVTPTKRKVIRVTSGFYDPMRFLAPIVVSYKALFQRACQLRLGWDDLLHSCSIHGGYSLTTCKTHHLYLSSDATLTGNQDHPRVL